MKEEFREIAGYEGLYEVSNFGNVRSLNYNKTGQVRVLKLVKDRCGYLNIKLRKEGEEKKHSVHRLVAQAFIDNPYNLPEVNHIDENKENNKVENLEWCDHKYNMTHGTLQERKAEALRGVYNNPKKSEIVLQMTLDYALVKEWASTAECGRNGFNQGAVSMCCNNKYGKQGNVHKGYRWVKKEDYENKVVS